MNRFAMLLLSTLAVTQPALANDAAIAVNDATREAYSQPIPAMVEADRAKFLKGRALVRQIWVIPPSENREIAGLGPLYNRFSCIACHGGNGRGYAPDTASEPMRCVVWSNNPSI